MWQGIIHKYREFLPVSKDTPVVTLNEGDTPLIPAKALSEVTGAKVYLKYEGANPTGSFKDRGMTMAVSKALEEGAKTVMCASTGNTSASAAAYAARAGIKCAVLIPQGAIALGKLSQALMHGAKVIAIRGNFDDALELVVRITSFYSVTLVNSLNPYRLEGQKTGAFEICDQLGKAPDYHFIPVGNAGNITAYWMGYREYGEAEKIISLPKMIGWQAEGAAPIVKKRVISNPETIATAIKIGNPARWKEAEEAARLSGGFIGAVSDEEILASYHFLSSQEGLFAEPASCASVAGLLRAQRENLLSLKGSVIVCILTGCGLKDPDRAIRESPKPIILPKDMDRVLEEIGIK
ncbi:MAG TPA: threonine synthase [Candidatus Omnitrophica bacterium]|nr:threonine synthase [Candidatus Omnitrophota bacterium]